VKTITLNVPNETADAIVKLCTKGRVKPDRGLSSTRWNGFQILGYARGSRITVGDTTYTIPNEYWYGDKV